MELHQLSYLVAIVDEGSFTRAAATVNVSQSGVSAQIGRLERELGQPLLDRSERTVKLTAAGEAVLPFARAALAAAAGAREAADEVAGLIRGSVRVGMVTGCSVPGFLDALAELHAAHPGLAVTLVEGPSTGLQGQVQAGVLNLALVGLAGDALPGLGVAVVIDEPLVAAVGVAHPLAARTSVRLRDLDAETVICMPEGTGIRAAFDRMRRSERSELRIALEASSPPAIAGLAARGLGVAILSASMVADDPGLVAIPLDALDVHAQLALVWRTETGLPAATRAVLAVMKAHLVGR